MTDRLDVLKTYKLFIDGQFPRSESGRSTPVLGLKGQTLAHISKASRKDLRDAVEAARKAQQKWADASAYLRGQIIYRMAEMMEGKRRELAEAIASVPSGQAKAGKGKKTTLPPAPSLREAENEVALAIDRLVSFAGWADKYAQVLGCNNPVSGPFYNFTVPEPTGVVVAVAPDARPLLALVSLLAPALCAGNAVVALASETNPLPAALLGEVCATSDVPAGVVNILTGERGELLSHIASHRDVDAVHAAGLSSEHSALLRAGTAENIKRVTIRDGVDFADAKACQNPWWIEPFVEMKTIWHPASV